MPIPENVENLGCKSSIYQVVCSWIITGVLKPGERSLIPSLRSDSMSAGPQCGRPFRS